MSWPPGRTTRAISATAAAGSSTWCRAMAQWQASKDSRRRKAVAPRSALQKRTLASPLAPRTRRGRGPAWPRSCPGPRPRPPRPQAPAAWRRCRCRCPAPAAPVDQGAQRAQSDVRMLELVADVVPAVGRDRRRSRGLRARRSARTRARARRLRRLPARWSAAAATWRNITSPGPKASGATARYQLQVPSRRCSSQPCSRSTARCLETRG